MIQVAVSSVGRHVSCDDLDLDRAADFTKVVFSFIRGVVEVSTDQGGANCLRVFITFSEDVFRGITRDMILPAEVGVCFKNSALNKVRFPRLWLKYRRTRAFVEKFVRERYRKNLTFKWVICVQRRDGTKIPLGA